MVDHPAQLSSYQGKQPQVLGELADGQSSYQNTFTAQPWTSPYKPPCPPKPQVPGQQSAIVTSPLGEEIYCDEYGRVKVQFYWDREGQGGEGSNELRFEDKAGSEEIYLHAARDYQERIENNSNSHIVNDRQQLIEGQHISEVRGELHHLVQGNSHWHAQGDAHQVSDANRHTQIGSKDLLEAGDELHIKAGQKVVIEANMEITLTAGGAMFKIDPSGIKAMGAALNINAGGKPDVGAGLGILRPSLPGEVGATTVGAVPEAKQAEKYIPRGALLKQASLLRQAARTGQGVCEICEAAKHEA